MGSYLNPGNKGFRESLNSEIYVDKIRSDRTDQTLLLIPEKSISA